MRDVFADHAYVRQMIEVEVALARAQSRVGAIPPQVGEALAKAVRDFEIE